MTPEQRAQNIMDQACLPMGLYVNGVVAAIQADIVKAIKEAIEEAMIDAAVTPAKPEERT